MFSYRNVFFMVDENQQEATYKIDVERFVFIGRRIGEEHLQKLAVLERRVFESSPSEEFLERRHN